MEATTGLDALTDFFGRYGAALAAADLPAIASCYALPGMVASGAYSFSFSSPAAVALSFIGAAPSYDEHQIVAAHAQIGEVREVGDGLTMVGVEWEYLNSRGEAVRGSAYDYILRPGPAGPQICVVLPR